MPRAAHRPAADRPRPRTAIALRTLALLGCAAALAACGERAAEAPPAGAEPTRVENPALGIALVGYEEAGFELVSAEGETFELRRPAEVDAEGNATNAEATLTYRAGPPQAAGVNLVAAVNDQKADMEARPGGHFEGQAELMSQIGRAYSTRGRYKVDDGSGDAGAEREEIRVFAVHPNGDRLLWMTYRYRPTADNARARMNEAMAALGLIEPLPPPAPPAEPAGDG